MPTPVVGTLGRRGIAAFPGYSVFILPWSGVKASGGTWARTQDASFLSGGRWDNSGVQNEYWEVSVWLDAGTYKLVLIYTTLTNAGIHNFTGINGSTQTINAYAATANNVYGEVAGIPVTAGLKTIRDTMATKDASSTGYFGYVQSLALIRTGA